MRLRRDTFQRAEQGEPDDPWTLNIWQRGYRVSFDIYSGRGMFKVEPTDPDEVPF